MLAELHIQNIAVIQKATIPLTEGFNVFTGETGAGKTILISAIDAVLGERTSRDIIRAGEEKAQVSALFEDVSEKTCELLEDMGYEVPDKSVLIFREMTASGRNTCRINGMPANVSTLKEASKYLIHIHGQRDSQQLLSKENHLEMVDDYGELQEDILEYSKIYQQLKEVQQKLNELDMDEAQKVQRLDMLSFQIKEIEMAHLKNPQEEDELLAKRRMASSSEKIRKGLSQAMSAYEGSSELPGAEELFSVMLSGVDSASQFMESLNPLTERLETQKHELSDIVNEILNSLFELDFDPAELEQIEQRLDTIYNLKKKYGSNITEILEFYSDAVQEYESISLSDQRRDELRAQINLLEQKCMTLATELSNKRRESSERFIKEVEQELLFLDMPNVKLSTEHNQIDFSPTGIDEIELMIVTNPGETPKPLGRIASGGEIARIMLGIKNVMADKDDIETLIFDEIDTGVSGQAAGKIGRKLSEVSKSRQVIGVTHLAQVAAYASNHLYIHKEIEQGRTYTKVDRLDEQQSTHELARITSGEIVTQAALESAKEMKERAKSF